jgi:hypothetical protein
MGWLIGDDPASEEDMALTRYGPALLSMAISRGAVIGCFSLLRGM